MKLLTIELLKTFKRIGDQSQEKDPMILAKFFHPFHQWTRFASEFDPETRIFFGFVDGDYPERGSFSLTEFEQLRIHGLGMERDRHFTPRRFSELNLN